MEKFNISEFKCKAFDQSQLRDEWRKYKRNFEYIAKAYEITDVIRLKNIFLAKAGPDIQEIVSTIPDADESYMNLMRKLDEYFALKQHLAFERHLFWKLRQEPGEPLGKYLLRAQEQANRCNFGKNAQDSRNITVMDKIILSAPQELREQLLAKKNLTIDVLSKSVNAYQAVKHQATHMVAATSPQDENLDVNRIISKPKPQAASICGRCGYSDHAFNDSRCPALGKICRKCEKPNHFEVMCRSRQGNPTRKRKNEGYEYQDKRPRQDYGFLRRPHKEERLNFINDTNDDNAIMEIKIGGVLTNILIDSGTKRNIMDMQTYQQLLQQGLTMESDDYATKYEFKGYSTDSNPLKISEVFTTKISIMDRGKLIETRDKFYVVENGSQPLLGRDTASDLGLLKIGLPSSINNVEVQKGRQFPKIKGVRLKIPIDKSVTPVQQHARRPPIALLKSIEDK